MNQDFEIAETVQTASCWTGSGDAAASEPRYSIQNKALVVAEFIARMQARGSSAKTLRGALRYARSAMEGGIPGLALLRSGKHATEGRWLSRRINFDTQHNWSHAARVQARAEAIYALTACGGSLLERLDACRSVSPRATPDLRRAIEEIATSAIERQVAAVLSYDWPYRQSSSTWAGGKHNVTVSVDDHPSASGDSERAWSANGKWSGTNSTATLTITERCLRNFGLMPVVTGLLTLDAERVGHREYRAVWVEQGRGFSLKTVEGWIIRGYHVAGGSLDAARRKAAAARHQRLMTLQSGRVEEKFRSRVYDLSSVMVTRGDSLAAGNCSAGTDSFIERFKKQLAGRTAVSAEELLQLRNDSRTRAVVSAAILRRRKEGNDATERE
ncbi:hypothetical protein [Cupriavidus sp. TMH.W2]|uniref:hypothetical protein n=1 Tax=Cupriavidus sp. TMH.W2 TaxID=3434465 RepID=UPI003D77A44A